MWQGGGKIICREAVHRPMILNNGKSFEEGALGLRLQSQVHVRGRQRDTKGYLIDGSRRKS